jgi:phosphoribosylamine--glycine ligase
MKALILGSGGREHAIFYKIQQELGENNVLITPGNGGTAKYSIKSDLNDFTQIKNIVIENNIDVIICGPEQPLANGIGDFFNNDDSLNKKIFIGPTQRAAKLESSKTFAKDFMQQYHIPTASFVNFNKTQFDEAKRFLEKLTAPYVIKASGLAAGKGVVITENINEAIETITEFFYKNTLGDAGNEIVIEEFIDGIEMSIFIATNGKDYVLLPEAKDYKKIGEGDSGPNTGGMGSVSPTDLLNDDLKNNIINKIIEPTLFGLQNMNIPFNGFIFFGLMIKNNEPYLLEYNVRLGDPETQVVVPRLESSLIELCVAINNGTLKNYKIKTNELYHCCITLASNGYPNNYEKNKIIKIENEKINSLIFHGGTQIDSNNNLVTSGGRVLYVVGYGDSLRAAQSMAYDDINKIHFDGIYYRKDIGDDILKMKL